MKAEAKPTLEGEIVTVLLVDDHRVVRAGLRSILDEYPGIQVVGEAADREAALRETARLKPAVVLLDLRLAKGSGSEVCLELKKLPSPPRVLILTSFADKAGILDAMAAGVDGYLLKDSQDDALVSAIFTVARGDSIIAPAVLDLMREQMNASELPPTAAGDACVKLTESERRMLTLIAEGKTNKEIGMALDLSEKTVRNQFTKTMAKLGVQRRSQAVALFVREKK